LENLVYVIVVESEDGTTAQVQSVHTTETSAEKERAKLQSALGLDYVVVVESHELQE
jgi:hypothetical protein